MSRSYAEFMDEITPDELYEGLLAYGFFAERIPPVFTAIPFFNYCKTAQFSPHWRDYVSFRIMRNVKIPRVMGIPNPFNYQRLCLELKNDWEEICKHFHATTDGQEYCVSRVHIRKRNKQKSIFEMNYKDWSVDGNPETDLLIRCNDASRVLVCADISTCFPSIYTHSLPWALVGKNVAKLNTKLSEWYNRIDRCCSDMRNGETHGILIGPHASNLLAEIILTAVDRELYDKGHRFLRNIDDYACYAASYEQAQSFLNDLEEALSKFDLLLNHKKTRVLELPIEIEKHWKNKLLDLPTIGKFGVVDYTQINKYIDVMLELARESGDDAIIKYAIKKLMGERLSNNAKEIASKRFMHMAILKSYMLHFMDEFVFEMCDMTVNQIKLFSDAVYREAKKMNNYEGLCYSLYYAIKYNFELEAFKLDYVAEQEYVIKTKDCVLLTITWVYFMKINNWNRTATQVKPLNNEAMALKKTDMERYWLFCYEALKHGSLADDWRNMKQAGISFIRQDLISAGKP